jgi:PAS domain S-box-containing protein
MINLQRLLHSCIKQSDLFFQTIQDYAAEGYIFWERGDNKHVLLDSSLSKQLETENLVNTKELKSFKKDFLELIIQKVESQLTEDYSDLSIFHTVIQEPINNTKARFVVFHDKEADSEYILAAIEDTTFFNINKSLINISGILDVAVWQCNLLTGELLINDNWADLLGYTKSELEPISVQTFQELTHPDDLVLAENEIKNYLTGKSNDYAVEVRMQHKNGHWKWVSAKGKGISRNEKGEVEWMIGSHIDITKRKINETELETLAQVAINTFNSVLITDSLGKIIFANAANTKLTGYEMDEVLGKKPGEFLQGPLTDENDINSFRKHLASGKSFTQEILNYSKEGIPYTVSCYVDPIYNEKGEISKFISVQRDITEEKRNKEYLETFKNTLDQTEECVFLFDKDSLKFTYVNQGAVNMLGYSNEELLRLHPYDIKPEYPEEKFRALIQPLLEEEVSSMRFKTIHKLKNGNQIPVEIFLQYIHNEKVRPHLVAVVVDITDRIEIEKELHQLSLVAQKTTNLVVITNEKGEVEYINPAFERKSGFSLDEMKGEKPGKFVHGKETNPEHIKANRAGLKKLEPFTQEILNYSKSGEKYWVSITFNPVFKENGELSNFIAIESDITERKRREVQLKESEERLQFVLKGSELGYWDMNLETGMTTMNERYYEMLGYTAENFEQSIHFYQSLVHPDDLSKLSSLMDSSFLAGGHDDFSIEVRVKHKLGHYVWIWDRGAVVKRNEKGTPIRISGIHMEISSRKNLEVELEKERQFLSTIINASALSLIIINRFGEIIFANIGAEHVLGLEKSSIESKRYNDPDWRHITLDGMPYPIEELPFAQVMKTKKPVTNIEHGIIWQDGTKKFISVTGAPLNYNDNQIEDVIFSVTDITDRVITQNQLDQTKNRMQSILKNMTDVVWSISIKENKTIYINPSVENLTGFPSSYYTDNSAIDKWEAQVINQDKSILKQAYSDLEKTGSFEVEHRILTKEGIIKWVLMKGVSIQTPNESERLDCYIADITARKEQENDVNRYLGIVEDQNERLKNFTYIVSHNLRSHSANIRGLMYLINTKHPEIADNEFVKFLDVASNKLEDTLHHLNNVVSVVSSVEEMKKIHLAKAINDFINSFGNVIAKSKIAVINEVNSDVVVEAVPAYLESIINNLLTNAIKYRDEEKSSFVKIMTRNFNGIVVMEIMDNGLGIDLKKYREKVFGMYKTFHNHKDARGLGLFLTKNQVESMGGKIEIDSKLGEGTTFKVFLKDGNV